SNGGWPDYLDERIECIHGDVRDAEKVAEAGKGVSAVYHFAAAVGVGQSMYQIDHYTDVNNRGSAVLLEALAKNPVKKLVVASNMSLYGEGYYQDRAGQLYSPPERNLDALKMAQWELTHGREELMPLPTAES